MTPQELDILLAQAGSTSFFAKGVGGFVATLVEQNERLAQALTEVRAERDNALAELAELRLQLSQLSSPSESNGLIDNNDVLKPPSEPPPDPTEAKALSPPKAVPALRNDPDRLSFIKESEHFTYKDNETMFYDILRESRSKAEICRRLRAGDGIHFAIGKLSHSAKAALINTFRSSELCFDELTADDFKSNWKPKKTTKNNI